MDPRVPHNPEPRLGKMVRNANHKLLVLAGYDSRLITICIFIGDDRTHGEACLLDAHAHVTVSSIELIY